MSPKMSASEWLKEGKQLTTQGKHKDALKSYDNALKEDKNSKEALLGKAVALQGLGKFKDAMKAYDQALKIDPLNKELWLQKATLSKQIMDFGDVAKCWGEIVKMDPSEENKRLLKEAEDAALTWEHFMEEAE